MESRMEVLGRSWDGRSTQGSASSTKLKALILTVERLPESYGVCVIGCLASRMLYLPAVSMESP